MSGSFQTSRDIFANPIWKNIVEFRLFFLIYGNAVFSDEGVRLADDLILKRGEWCRSTRKIQEDLTYIENRQVKTYSTSVINRCIKKLEQSQRICTRLHELGTVFTVLNYEQYQGFGVMKKQNLEQNLEQCWNSSGTVEEQSGNNNKNVNNDKKVNKVSNKTYTSDFESFWSVYPRKLSKPAAFTKWKTAIKQDEPSYIIRCATNYAKECEFRQTDEQYIKHPSTFLGQERYRDYAMIVLGGGNGGKYEGRAQGVQYGRNSSESRGTSISDDEMDELFKASGLP